MGQTVICYRMKISYSRYKPVEYVTCWSCPKSGFVDRDAWAVIPFRIDPKTKREVIQKEVFNWNAFQITIFLWKVGYINIGDECRRTNMLHNGIIPTDSLRIFKVNGPWRLTLTVWKIESGGSEQIKTSNVLVSPINMLYKV